MNEEKLIAQLKNLEEQKVEIEIKISFLKTLMEDLSEITYQDTQTKRSYDRIFFENKILDFLNDNPPEYTTKKLFNVFGNFHPSLKYATFRSHLFRMKEKELITQRPNKTWKAINDK